MKQNKVISEKEKISDFLNAELPKARKDEWFTRKVLNRLPPHRAGHSIIEKWIMLFAVLGVTSGLIYQSVHLGTSNVIVVGDLVMMGIFIISFLIMGFWIVYPLVKN